MNEGMNEKEGVSGFIGSLKRKMNKNVNDLKTFLMIWMKKIVENKILF